MPGSSNRRSVLDEQIITALLSVTKGRDYEAIRDHAIVRLLLTGLRRQELVSLRVESVELTARVLVTVGLKGKPGRPVAFGHKTAHALAQWLRVRAANRMRTAPTAGRCGWRRGTGRRFPAMASIRCCAVARCRPATRAMPCDRICSGTPERISTWPMAAPRAT